jgi:hypothetical protein
MGLTKSYGNENQKLSKFEISNNSHIQNRIELRTYEGKQASERSNTYSLPVILGET